MPDSRIHLLVEGQTEWFVVDRVIQPYLEQADRVVSKTILVTRRPAAGPFHRGGVTSWHKLSHDIRLLLGDSSLDVLTTMIDYYAFPADAPGMATRPSGDPVRAVQHVERAIAEAVGDRRFVPHLTLHEIEAWVFAAADELAALVDAPELAATLHAEARAAGGPELVDDGPATAPSRRLRRHHPAYRKTQDGPDALELLGVPALRASCPHADRWLSDLLTT